MHNFQNFCPQRLIVARERRGLSQTALAQEIGVTKDAISKMEGGSIVNPDRANVARMSLVLQFPIGWFYEPELELFAAEDLTFRARRKMSAKVRRRCTKATDIAVGVISPALRRRFKLPDCELPNLSSHTPEEAAMTLRSMWSLGQSPVASMVQLLETRGIEIYWLSEPTDHMDAWSAWRGSVASVFLNTHKIAGEREQFDAAHELGHLVLHRSIDTIEDEDEPRGRKIESEANQFASAFLLPREQFKMEIPKAAVLQAYLPLKQRWCVSIAAMIMRSRDLGSLSDWQVQNLFRDLAVKGWRKKEPRELPRQSSRLHQLAFEKLAAKGISPDQFAKQLELPVGEIHEMMPVSKHISSPPPPASEITVKHLTLLG